MKKALTPDNYAEYLNEAIQQNGLESLASFLGGVVKAEGTRKISEETGLAREALYRSFSKEGNPTLKTIAKVLDVAGLSVRFVESKG